MPRLLIAETFPDMLKIEARDSKVEQFLFLDLQSSKEESLPGIDVRVRQP